MENTKQEKYINSKCPNCGSELHFLPNSLKTQCESCGSTFGINSLGRGKLDDEEENLDEVLKKISEHKVAQKVQRTIHCSDCGGLIYLNERTVATKCPFCGSNRVVDENKSQDIIDIKGVIPFVIKEDEVRTHFKEWIRKRFFAPSKFKKGILSPSYAAFYIPYYTFDSDTYTKYTGERGDDYTVTRTIKTKDGTRTVTETRTKWTFVSGSFAMYFDDVLVLGTNNILNGYIRKISNYDFNKMEKYQEQFMLGYSAEKPSVSLRDGFTQGKNQMENTIRSECVRRIGGDRYRNLNYHVNYSNVTFKEIMAPIYNGSYEYQNKKYNFVCNGQNGKFSGKFPISAIKVSILVILIIALVVGLSILLYIFSKG